MLSCLIELRGRPCVVDAGLCGDNGGFTKDAIVLAKTQTRTHTGYNGTTNRWFSVAEEALFEDDTIRVDELFRHSLTRGTVSSLFWGGTRARVRRTPLSETIPPTRTCAHLRPRTSPLRPQQHFNLLSKCCFLPCGAEPVFLFMAAVELMRDDRKSAFLSH